MKWQSLLCSCERTSKKRKTTLTVKLFITLGKGDTLSRRAVNFLHQGPNNFSSLVELMRFWRVTTSSLFQIKTLRGTGISKSVYLFILPEIFSSRVVDLQPDGLTAGLAGHCQPDKKISLVSERKRNDLYICFKRNNFTSSAPMFSK